MSAEAAGHPFAAALAGVRVLDLSQYVAGPFCARLLGDYGADVIKIERPGRGDVARYAGPFRDDAPDPAASGLFLYLNTNKRSVALDLATTAGRAALLRLVAGADALVESFRPGTLEQWGLGPDALLAVNPQLVVLRLSNFGQSGPYRDWKASEIVLYAIGGEMYSTGVAGYEPIKLFGTTMQIEAGAVAAAATLGALLHAEATGQGQVIDCALTETQLAGIDRRAPTLMAYAYSGKLGARTAGAGGLPRIWPCRDGYVDLALGSGRMWPRALEMLGRPENLLDPRFLDPTALAQPALRDEFVATVLTWSVERSKQEVWRAAQAARVMSGPINTIADVFADPTLRARGVFATVDHPVAGRLEQPARPFVMSRTPAAPPRPAPLLGQHTAEVLAETLARGTASDADTAPKRAEAPASPGAGQAAIGRLPLAGVRVADLTVVWAGPFAAHILADLGAEVIRVENVNAWQTMTRGPMARPSQAVIDGLAVYMGGYPDGVPGDRPWNRYPAFNTHARNKLSCTLDLRTPAGKRNFAQLIATCDIVLDNNVAETTRKLGVTYASLRAMREDIVYLRQPALADEGPYAADRAFGIHLEGLIGHTLLRRYPELDASLTSPVFVADYMGGALGAFAVLLALRHRRRTGEGQLIELGQAENALAILAQAIMDHALNRRQPEPLGNRATCALQGVYPCAPEGDDDAGHDRWLALTIATDAEWAALGRVLDDPAWSTFAAAPAFGDAAGRRTHQDEIDARLRAWTRTQRARAAMERLQAAGIAAGVVMNARDCYEDPQLAARAFFRTVTQADCGTRLLPGFMWQFAGTPLAIRRGPVRLGEDNARIYRDLLGFTADAYASLLADGEIGDSFAAHVP